MTRFEAPLMDPLDMARNLTAAVQRAAEWADADPAGAMIGRVGERQRAAADSAGAMALVSIAVDLRRIADMMEAGRQLPATAGP